MRDYGLEEAGIGLEETFDEFLDNMVAVGREIYRVLRDDGTFWMNLGDAYAQKKTGESSSGSVLGKGRTDGRKFYESEMPRGREIFKRRNLIPEGLKSKDLIGIPWRVALAMQTDGCIDINAVNTIGRVRQEILNAYEDDPIPDRIINVLERLDLEYGEAKGNSWYLRSDIIWHKPNPMPESVTDRPAKAHEYVFLLTKRAKYYYDNDAIREPHSESTLKRIKYPHHPSKRGGGSNLEHGHGFKKGGSRDYMVEKGQAYYTNPGGRNRRTVWSIVTQTFPGAHFATFPEALVEPMIKAGSPVGGLVLDPFCGSGTTGVVARRLYRKFVGLDLSAKYLKIAQRRSQIDALKAWNAGDGLKDDRDYSNLFSVLPNNE